MNLMVLGASGGVGQRLVEQALAGGHHVHVVLRDPNRLPTDVLAQLQLVRCDLATDRTERSVHELADAVAGMDAVLSALGARTAADQGVLTRAAESVVAAMAQAELRRYVGVSAAPVGTVPTRQRPRPPRHDPGDDLVARYLMMPVVKRLFAANYADAAAMEEVIRASSLEWTIVRPPRLIDGPATGHYRTAVDQNVRGGRHISRADVAALMLSSVRDPSTIGHTVGIAD